MGEFRGLLLASARAADPLGDIAGPACPYILPIAGRPLINHALRSLAAAGAGEILVVASPEIVADVEAAAGDPGVPVSFATGAAALGAGEVLVHFGDSLLPSGFRAKSVPCAFVVDGGVVACALDELPEDLDAGSRPAIPTEHVELDGGWRYDGTVDGILDANRLALDELKRGRIGADLTSASVQGRVQIHPTAMLYGAKVRGPAYIGPEAIVSETYVGPYTSIGAGVRLEGVEIEHSIVLPSAAIRFPGRRIEGSLVGEGAQIGRDFSLPSALRLRVGRGADIQLS